MEKHNIVIGLLSILVLLYFIKQVYGNNSLLEGFIDTNAAEKSYKLAGNKFVKGIEDKYVELGKLEVPINVDDYGNQCINWSEMDVKKPTNIILENQCVPMDGELKCISNKREGTLNSCERMAQTTIGHMVNVETNKDDVEKYTRKHIELEQNINDMNNELSKVIGEITKLDNLDNMQKYQIQQNKELIQLRSEKNDNLQEQKNKKIDEYNIDYQTVTQLRNNKHVLQKNIDYITFYTKLVLSLFILILLGMVLSANIKSLS
jgi:hypothetical protein